MEREHRLREILDIMFAFVGFLSPDGIVLETNRAFLEAAGLRCEDVIGQPLPDTYYLSHCEATREHVRQALQRAAAGETVRAHFSVRLASDRLIDLDTTFGPLRDSTGKIVQVVGLGFDVTNRAAEPFQTEKAESEERFWELANAVPTIICVTNAAGECTFVNEQWYTLTGQTPEQALGFGWLDRVHADDRPGAMEHFLVANEKRIEFVMEYRVRRHDGKYRSVIDSGRPQFGPNGDFRGFIGSVLDITERKALEDQLRQSQKMEALGQLAGGVAHDFNNALTVIFGNTGILLSTLPPHDPMRPMVEEIGRAGDRAASLTRQLLAFSRKTLLEPKVLDLNTIVGTMERMFARLIGEDVRLTTALDPKLKHVKVDPGLLGQVLMNVVINARDAMPKGGRLTIETANVELDHGAADTHADLRPGQYVMLAVTDNGAGMAREVMERIFEPFFTTKGPGLGSGLGLAVVHGIAKQSGAHVEVDSEPGSGTTFKIYFPAVDEWRVAPTSEDQDPGKTERRTETVLLVEDENDVRQLILRILQERGYTVLVAADGQEAMQIVERHQGPIDLLVTDVVMPGMDGQEVAAAICSRFPQVKVLYLSGYTDDAVVRHGILREEVAFLQKPFSPLSLATKVRDVLEKK